MVKLGDVGVWGHGGDMGGQGDKVETWGCGAIGDMGGYGDNVGTWEGI